MVGLIINCQPEHKLMSDVFCKGIERNAGICDWTLWPLGSRCVPSIPYNDGSVKILFCTNKGDTAVDKAVDSLRDRIRGAEVTVYAHGEHDSGELALDCLDCGARDFFNVTMPANLVGKRVEYALKKGVTPYPKIEVDIASGSRVFVSTPYSPEAEIDITAMEAAIKRAGFFSQVSRETLPAEELYKKVTDEISESKLVVANCTVYTQSGHNANVFLEIGFALAKGIPVVYFMRVGSPPLPALLRGKLCGQFHTAADLAVQLCYGLSGQSRHEKD